MEYERYRTDKYGLDYEEVNSAINRVDEHWKDMMPMMAMEELGELIQAISKVERLGQSSMNDLRKELADVYISLYAIMKRYDIEGEEIRQLMNEKLSKPYDSKELREFIMNNGGNNSLVNCLLRNDICSKGQLMALIKKGPNWYKNLRHIGKAKAEQIEDIIGTDEAFRKKYKD